MFFVVIQDYIASIFADPQSVFRDFRVTLVKYTVRLFEEWVKRTFIDKTYHKTKDEDHVFLR